jgi:hypothetical protein
MGGQLGNLEWDHLTRTEVWLKEALEVECLCLWELSEGKLEGGIPCWDPEGGRLRERTSISVGAMLGNL